MNKLLEVVVNGSSRTVMEENGVEVFDFPLWRDRLAQLEAGGWGIVKVERNEEKNRVVYYLEKDEEVRWEYMRGDSSGPDPFKPLNELGKEGWELVSTIEDLVRGSGEGFYTHFLKRRVVS